MITIPCRSVIRQQLRRLQVVCVADQHIAAEPQALSLNDPPTGNNYPSTQQAPSLNDPPTGNN